MSSTIIIGEDRKTKACFIADAVNRIAIDELTTVAKRAVDGWLAKIQSSPTDAVLSIPLEKKEVTTRYDLEEESRRFASESIVPEALKSAVVNIRKQHGNSPLPEVNVRKGLLNLNFSSAEQAKDWLGNHAEEIKEKIKIRIASALYDKAVDAYVGNAVREDRFPG